MRSVKSKPAEWKTFYDSQQPEVAPMPEPLKNTKDLAHLVILRCVRPDKLVPAVQVNIVQYSVYYCGYSVELL